MKKIIAYKISHSDKEDGWIGGLTTPKQVAEFIKIEIEEHQGAYSLEELPEIVITPYETTQEEIDSLSEFEGW